MGIAEMKQQFSAYGSGQLPELELRSFIRRALKKEPQLSSACIALTDAYRRANLIDAKLQTTINADIVGVTGPLAGLTKVRQPAEAASPIMRATVTRPGVADLSDTGWIADNRAANSTDVNIAAGMTAGPGAANRGAVASAVTTGSKSGSTSGSTWDIGEGLSEVAAPLYPGSVIRDRFVLVEELGRGGMGVVYKACDRSRGDVKDPYVAIKILSEDFKRHPLAVRALQREARKAQKLAHPNVVAVHDFDRDGGNVYMVMEYLSGRSLDHVLREDGQGGIPLGPAMDIIKGLAAALSYAHEQDIIHCDFKPGNAFLNRDGRVKVLDFGIARAAPSVAERGDTTLFDAGQLGAVSPAYSSFELLQGQPPDVRDDVYSFACVAYELLTGSHPYQRLDAVKASQAGLQPRPIRKLSRGQWRALKQGLSFRRADRCPSIDSLARELVPRQSNTTLWVGAAAAGVAAVLLVAVVAWKGFGIPAQKGQTPLAESGPPLARSEEPSSVAKMGEPARAGLSREAPNGVPSDETPSTTAPWGQASSAMPSGQAPTAEGVRADNGHRQPAAVPPKPTGLIATDAPILARAPSVTRAPVATGGPTAAGAPITTGAPVATGGPNATGEPTAAGTPNASGEESRVKIEMLREQFETQATDGDLVGATTSARALARAWPGSPYVIREIPRILVLSYIHLAKTQFAAGNVNAALQKLDEGRNKFAKSTELKDLQVRYVDAANIYDRLSTAVVLNVNDIKSSLETLKASEGDEYDVAAQMLAQTLADRIADQRAANRDTVADKLLESGKQIFPDYTGILGRGKAGVLRTEPIATDAQTGQPASADTPNGAKPDANLPSRAASSQSDKADPNPH